MNEHSVGFSLKKETVVGIIPPLLENLFPTLLGEEREQALTVKEEVHKSLCLQLGWHRGNITLVPCIYTRDGSFLFFIEIFYIKKLW